jgi:septal ring-binding cell division protein DamX
VKPTPRRGVKPAPRKKRRRLGTILFFIGLLAVLGGTFAAGALAGRLSLKPISVVNAKGEKERAAKPAPPPPPQGPELTFYRELTAPLTPPPPPPKPGRSAPKKDEPAKKEEPAKPDAPKSDAPKADAEHAKSETPAPAPAAKSDASRYTVQVGSYNVRAQADALRAKLAAAGHEAYVAEGEAGGVMRYRVRIGAYATAEDARQAAVRLASEAHVATYVTAR